MGSCYFFCNFAAQKGIIHTKGKNIMGGFFGTISTTDCVNDLFYGTDYNSHLGTKRAGLVTFDEESGFHRSIHSLERQYFRSRFEDELDQFKGHQGVGVISDTDPQPDALVKASRPYGVRGMCLHTSQAQAFLSPESDRIVISKD